jgi:hypothetical protein
MLAEAHHFQSPWAAQSHHIFGVSACDDAQGPALLVSAHRWGAGARAVNYGIVFS